MNFHSFRMAYFIFLFFDDCKCIVTLHDYFLPVNKTYDKMLSGSFLCVAGLKQRLEDGG